MKAINLNIEKPFVFISYAKEDLEVAIKLYNNLNRDALKPWLDIHHLPPGVKWENVIEQTIKNCKFFLLLLSKNSVSKRGFIQKEIKLAFDVVELLPGESIFIIPLKLDDCEVPTVLSSYHWIQYSQKNSYLKLKNTLIKFLGKEYITSPHTKTEKINIPKIIPVIKLKDFFETDFREFCRASGSYIICKGYRNKIFVSNLHIGELREDLPKNLTPKREVSKASVDAVIPKTKLYRKTENIVVSIEPVDEKIYILTAKNGNAVYAAINYVDYFITKYYKCDLFIWRNDYISLIPIDHQNNFIGLIMPLTPPIK